MKQKDIKREIFILLKKSKLHQRKLGRILKTNQTNIRRALLSLEKENIVDKKDVGKSKNYFIKNSLETFIYEKIVENYKLMNIIKKPKIRKIFKEIQDKINLNKLDQKLIIVLFGSYAKNLETKTSDIDIYIDSNSKKDKKLIEEISDNINIIQGKFDKDGDLFNEIKRDHVVLNNLNGFFSLIK